MVEALVLPGKDAKRDLVVPAGGWTDLASANEAALAWCAEVNQRKHSEIAAVPMERLATERTLLRALPSLRPPLREGAIRKVDRLSTVRFGSARYSAPARLRGARVEVLAGEGTVTIRHEGREVAHHPLVGPGEVALCDDHYGGPANRPARAVRPRDRVEAAFVALGPVAEAFLRLAAAAGTPRLAGELAEIVALEAAWGRPALERALGRATRFRRFRAADVRSILAAGHGAPTPARPGADLRVGLPVVPMRPLSAYALEAAR